MMEKSNSRLKNLTGFAGTRSDEGESWLAKKLHCGDVMTVIWNEEKKNVGGRDSDGEAEGEGEAETFENSNL
ncbi:hypothetical protein ISN45_At05g024330 [Arabidopsis thaliana x Arabidopsis arenosa]|uniref:Uncharacterized protein n=4 Tax=Arabidopsis TaxID=3701 RepID=A0A5S9Y7B8_ARATH|nr:uncharacterized protein AT5G25750 [Arabidopsis thaliana]AED93478.1 hypothetical protein AT5G25750 [Arabidopsis thaliana]KAG7603472.1 hypothetical protein ISN45_At05g024330 [Arabidopsis thaliana x Arabidopsis arenosa]KAG7610399.1 hypothetical protein ISN44_As05g024150 [Arabidopsis suecica]CAA0404832.1 unnamed protein product [Arabidopsis thaliana]|eukprot:NP_197947.1 hypothetical protein AT5G25750 [Arabidopsis thaliana]